MAITIRRFLLGCALALTAQLGLFAWSYQDLLYFRRPPSAITADGAPTFVAHAAAALSRRHLTRQHLDTIAEVARALNEPAYELHALERRLELDPRDQPTRMGLADALRRAGQYERSEGMYLEVLGDVEVRR